MTETGSPEMLMELAYRLSVEETPFIQNIRNNVITLITPVIEVDGREKQVDTYYFNKKRSTGDVRLPLMYWGKYVAHDNNRDAMGMTLKLTQNVLNTYVDWKAQVLHDLHESGSFLYDNTIGDGPYNSWLDPLVTNEWQMIGWNNVQEMTRYGMPGVFAHGNFDTWSPGYLMFIAATHNGISRLYETFGNGGAAAARPPRAGARDLPLGQGRDRGQDPRPDDRRRLRRRHPRSRGRSRPPGSSLRHADFKVEKKRVRAAHAGAAPGPGESRADSAQDRA